MQWAMRRPSSEPSSQRPLAGDRQLLLPPSLCQVDNTKLHARKISLLTHKGGLLAPSWVATTAAVEDNQASQGDVHQELSKRMVCFMAETNGPLSWQGFLHESHPMACAQGFCVPAETPGFAALCATMESSSSSSIDSSVQAAAPSASSDDISGVLQASAASRWLGRSPAQDNKIS